MAKANPVQIQKYLKDVDYPASKQVLLDRARELGADDKVRETLEQLPEQDYETPTDVSKAIGNIG